MASAGEISTTGMMLADTSIQRRAGMIAPRKLVLDYQRGIIIDIPVNEIQNIGISTYLGILNVEYEMGY